MVVKLLVLKLEKLKEFEKWVLKLEKLKEFEKWGLKLVVKLLGLK